MTRAEEVFNLIGFHLSEMVSVPNFRDSRDDGKEVLLELIDFVENMELHILPHRVKMGGSRPLPNHIPFDDDRGFHIVVAAEIRSGTKRVKAPSTYAIVYEDGRGSVQIPSHWYGLLEDHRIDVKSTFRDWMSGFYRDKLESMYRKYHGAIKDTAERREEIFEDHMRKNKRTLTRHAQERMKKTLQTCRYQDLEPEFIMRLAQECAKDRSKMKTFVEHLSTYVADLRMLSVRDIRDIQCEIIAEEIQRG
jgi:hypothetical protein